MIVLKAGRIATGVERPKPPLQWLRRGSLRCSDPPRPPRPAGSPGTKGGVCCLSRREPSTDIPQLAGTAVGTAGKGSVDAHSPVPSVNPGCCSRARSRLPSRAPTSAQRAVGTAASLPGAGATARCSKRGSKTKGILPASFLPRGSEPRTRHRLHRAAPTRVGLPEARPPHPEEPLWVPELWCHGPHRAGSWAHYRTKPGRGRDRRERYPLDPEEGTKDGCGHRAG